MAEATRKFTQSLIGKTTIKQEIRTYPFGNGICADLVFCRRNCKAFPDKRFLSVLEKKREIKPQQLLLSLSLLLQPQPVQQQQQPSFLLQP